MMRSFSQLKSRHAPEDEDDFDGLDIHAHRAGGADFDQAKLLLPQLMIGKALPRKALRNLRTGRPIAIIIIVPEPSLAAIELALLGMCSTALRVVQCRAKKNDVEQLQGIAGVGAGAPVVYLTSDINYVPSLAQKLCSDVFVLDGIDAGLVRTALRRCTRGRVPTSFAPDLSGIALPIVSAAIVSGALAVNAMSALDRLAAPTPAPDQSDFPKLSECIEYGSLREWALRLSDDLQAWKAGKLSGADLDSSILLVSPPGFGKSYFAGVLQKHLNVPLFHLRIGEVMAGDGYLHNTLKNMTTAFEAARHAAPAILFLDEVDSFERRGESDKNDKYFNSLVNHILVLLDGAGNRNDGVIIIGATNRPDAIDPALCRPGRLSRTIVLPLPDSQARKSILRTHLGPLIGDADLDVIARRTTGATPSQLMQLVKEAKAKARHEKTAVRLEHLMPAQQQLLSAAMKQKVAVHEAGHATCAVLLHDSGMKLTRVTIEGSGGSGGHTSFGAENSTGHSAAGFSHRAMVLLAGRAAELVLLGNEKSIGAGGSSSSDLALATKLTAASIASFGLHDRLAWRCEPDEAQAMLNVDSEFREAVEDKLQELMGATLELIRQHQSSVRNLAKYLIEHGTAEADAVTRIVLPSRQRHRSASKSRKAEGDVQ